MIFTIIDDTNVFAHAVNTEEEECDRNFSEAEYSRFKLELDEVTDLKSEALIYVRAFCEETIAQVNEGKDEFDPRYVEVVRLPGGFAAVTFHQPIHQGYISSCLVFHSGTEETRREQGLEEKK